jgi:hypothetical protein
MDQELVQYLEGRFERQEQRFQTLLDHRFGTVDQRFDAVDRRFEETKEQLEEVKRHTGVLVEGLRHEIQLVAEGLVMHIEVRHREDREYFDRKFGDMSTLFHKSLYFDCHSGLDPESSLCVIPTEVGIHLPHEPGSPLSRG